MVAVVVAALADVAAAAADAGDEKRCTEATCKFSVLNNTTNNSKQNHMKKLLTLTTIVSAMSALALITGCETTGTSQAGPQKEPLLAQSGFKVITVTTPKQQQAISGLAQGRCSAVKYQGKLYYVYPTATKDRIYVGRQAQFNAYKRALAAQQPTQQPSQAQTGQTAYQQQQQQMAQGSPVWAGETAGPRHVEVEEFDGFGPINPMQGD